jgi:hypothetical protein
MSKINLTNWKYEEDGWVFLSHSHKDQEEVKIVRNYLEENNFNAIMYYLHCFRDRGEKPEIQELIECEIKSRNIFVLCDSDNAKQSDWVKREITYARSFSEKKIITIDIEKLKYQKATQLSILDELMNKSTLFLSYLSEDKPRVNKISNKLASLGFKILKDTGHSKYGKSENISQQIYNALHEVKNQGVVLLFLSKHSKESHYFWNEKEVIINSGNYIIPILIDRININDFPAFRNYKYIDFTHTDFEKSFSLLLQMIKTIKENK